MPAARNSAGRLHCAHVARQCCEDPIGSVFLPNCVVLIELPLPWSEQVWRSPQVSPLLREAIDQLEGAGARCYAIAPDAEYSLPGMARVLLFSRPAGLFVRFEPAEYLVPAASVPGLLSALAEHGAQPATYERFSIPPGATRELLVCTHGSLDACCGQLGYPLYQLLREQYADSDLRVWRISHFGGHRFAPTMLEFPSGLGWAYLEPRTLDRVVRRHGPVYEAMPHYRGCGGLNSYYLQLAERAILLHEGWKWLDYSRGGIVLQGRSDGYPIYDEDAENEARVRIRFCAPDGCRSGCYEATIERAGRLLTALSCSGHGLQSVHQYRVRNLQLVDRAASGSSVVCL